MNKEQMRLLSNRVLDIFSKGGIIIVLIVICVIISIMTDRFFTANNLINIARQTSINGIMAIGISFVVMTRGIDLSVGSVMAFSSAITCTLLTSGTSP